MRLPEIKIKNSGRHSEIFVDGKKLDGIKGCRFIHSTSENEGLPILQIDVVAADVTLETDILPALPYPFNQHYIPISVLLDSGKMTDADINSVCREYGLDLEIV